MHTIGTEVGIVSIPDNASENVASFSIKDADSAYSYYSREGYVLIRGLIPRDLCEQARAAYRTDLRPSRVPILRQKNMHYERNSFDDDGFLENPIFNIQDLDVHHFGRFRSAALDILTSAGVAAFTDKLLGGPPKLIQSMFFEAPANTWPHQDSYYQDSARSLGGAVAGWFALEDIDAGAGRFYVCPQSNMEKILIRNGGELSFADAHERYKNAMVELISAHLLPVRAPYLGAGDVLFWSSATIHGSLAASRPGHSRTSLTAHYFRASDELLQFHSRIRTQQMSSYNGMPLGLLHDQNRLRNRLVREVAFRFPRPYAVARKLALRTVIRGEKTASTTLSRRRKAGA